MKERFEHDDLLAFIQGLFQAEGLPDGMARVVALGFLEADLLGYRSHGLVRVPANLSWLRAGQTERQGEPLVLTERPALANWDAHRLPGHWAMHLALAHAIRQTREVGTFTLTLRRAQHVACLAATLIPVVEAELVALMVVSSPEEAFVSPFGGSERLFSNNPLAFTAPTPSGPILLDVSMAITAGGQVARAARQGWMLPEAAIRTPEGTTSADPADFARGGSVMPIGGLGHGHKGHALTVMTEVLTQALGGYGRASSRGVSEQNSVWLHLMDPAAFTTRADYDREVAHLVRMIEESRPDDPARRIRVPGQRAWRARARQIREGVELDAETMAGMAPYAEAAGLALPAPLP